MKKLIVPLVALAFVTTLVFAGVYETRNVSRNTGTNVVVNPSDEILATPIYSNLVSGAFVCANTTVDLYVSFQLRGAGTSAVTFSPQRSYDGNVWVDINPFNVTASGSTLVSGTTNLTLGNYGYVRVVNIDNPNATGITNLTVRWSCKN